MTDEVTIQIEPDPQAEMDARSAAMYAESAARDADMAAAAAAGAAVAQGQLIGQVMEHAREDAREDASDAQAAAEEAEAAAEQAIAINTITAEMWLEMEKRIAALEARGFEVREESAPDVAEIGGEESSQAPEKGSSGEAGEGGGNTEPAVRSSSGRRPHGRRGR